MSTGRAFTKQLAEATEAFAAGDVSAKSSIIKDARGYVRLLTDHIAKENEILCPMANSVFTEDDQHELMEKFEEVEKAMRPGIHERYTALVEELEAQVRNLGSKVRSQS